MNAACHLYYSTPFCGLAKTPHTVGARTRRDRRGVEVTSRAEQDNLDKGNTRIMGLFARSESVAQTSELWLSAPDLYGPYACLYAAIARFDVAERLFTTIVANARDRGAVRVLPYPLSGRALVDLHLGRRPRGEGEQVVVPNGAPVVEKN